MFLVPLHSANVNEKRERPEIGKVPLFFPHTCGMCFSSGYSSKVAPLRCPLRFTGRSS